MKVTYTGVQKTLPAKLQAKLDVKFAKLGKLIEQKGEREVHVVHTQERHLHKAEITMNVHDRQLVCACTDDDLFTAVNMAIEKLETQALRLRTKFREKTRRNGPDKEAASVNGAGRAKAAVAVEPAEEEAEAGPEVFRVNHHQKRKPITLDEAMLAMEDGRPYLVYRDADRQCVSVLIRRKDNNFDLIES